MRMILRKTALNFYSNLKRYYYLIEQVEFSQLLADVDLLYFHRGQPQHRELHEDGRYLRDGTYSL